MQDYYSPPSSLIHRFYHTPLHLHLGRLRPRQYLDLLRHQYVHYYVALLPISTTAGLGPRRDGAGADCAVIRPMEKMRHGQLVPRSRMAQRFMGSGFKIATDIAGMLGSSEKPLQDLAVRFH